MRKILLTTTAILALGAGAALAQPSSSPNAAGDGGSYHDSYRSEYGYHYAEPGYDATTTGSIGGGTVMSELEPGTAAAGATTGAVAGVAMGAAVGGPLGAVIGGVAGAAIGSGAVIPAHAQQ